MIDITDELKLVSFDKDKYNWVIEEINTDSKSNFIHDIEPRLTLSRPSDKIQFNTGYLVMYNNSIVGYAFISSKSNHIFYFEYLVFKKYRNQGLGNIILNEVTDKVMRDNQDIKECHLSIYKSNIVSMKVANNNYFYEDDDTYNQNTIEFIKDNPYFINKSRK